MTKYYYFRNCVDWPQSQVHAEGGLCDLIDGAINVSRATFLKHVSRESLKKLEKALGYTSHPSSGLTMAGDYHVSYHRGKLAGHRVYFFTHSAIEYVFTPEGRRIECEQPHLVGGPEDVFARTFKRSKEKQRTPLGNQPRTGFHENISIQSFKEPQTMPAVSESSNSSEQSTPRQVRSISDNPSTDLSINLMAYVIENREELDGKVTMQELHAKLRKQFNLVKLHKSVLQKVIDAVKLAVKEPDTESLAKKFPKTTRQKTDVVQRENIRDFNLAAIELRRNEAAKRGEIYVLTEREELAMRQTVAFGLTSVYAWQQRTGDRLRPANSPVDCVAVFPCDELAEIERREAIAAAKKTEADKPVAGNDDGDRQRPETGQPSFEDEDRDYLGNNEEEALNGRSNHLSLT